MNSTVSRSSTGPAGAAALPETARASGTTSWLNRLRKWAQDPAVQVRNADVFAVLAAASLPWSTTPPAVFMVLWFISLIPTLDGRALLRSLARSASALPLALFALAIVGTLWSDSTWAARLHGINPVSKLAAIPFLLYHFERSQRGHWVFKAFLISCALLMVLSWIVLVAPGLKISSNYSDGVPVKNYIDQSQEFALCLFTLASPALAFIRQRRVGAALVCGALMLGFFANMMFVVSARTALVYIPVLLLLFAVLHLKGRTLLLTLVVAVIAALTIWFTSPYLRSRVTNIAAEYQGYQDNEVTSTGERLEYWRKSLKFIAAAPLFGHGTGSIKALFEHDAIGQSGLSADVIGNPHNQTLSVAVQWGMAGVVILIAMWISHLLLFRGTGLVAWIGLLVVVQNIVSSLLNSHLFDFHEGWMYVLGVGVAGGMALRQRLTAKTEGRL